MPTILTSDPVVEGKLETNVNILFNEWLGKYFDGGNHAIGNNAPQTFPLAVLLFQQAPVPQPLSGAAISMVWLTQSQPKLRWDIQNGLRQQLAIVDIHWLFIVRAQQADTGTGNAKMAARTVSDLLYALLQNSLNTYALSQKGIHELRPNTPQVMSEGTGSTGDMGYIMRSVTCKARLRYYVVSQPTS